MDTQIKISSNEGGVFTAQNNRCSFSIPAGGHYDLSEAYVNLVCSVPITSEEERTGTSVGASPFRPNGVGAGGVTYTQTTANGVGVYPFGIRMNDDGGTQQPFHFHNAVLVKNIDMKCNNYGSIERCIRNDVYSASVQTYADNHGDNESRAYKDLFKPVTSTNSFDSLFTDMNKEGTVNSRNLSRQAVRIPLKDMLNFAKNTQYNTGKYGRTDINMELNIDRVRVGQLQGQDTTYEIDLGGDGRTNPQTDYGDQNLFAMLPLNANQGANLNELMIAQSQTGNTQGGVEQGVHRAFNRLSDCPYFVGQKIHVAAVYGRNNGAARNGDTNVLLVTRQIIEIRYNRGETTVGMNGRLSNTNSITLVLNAAIQAAGALAGNEVYTGVQVRGATCTNGAFQVDFAELVVKQINPSNVVNEPDSAITYKTYETEEYTGAAVTAFSRMFECPPNCMNLFIAHNEAAAVRGFNSRLRGIDNYRLRIDNKDASDRLIRLRENGANTNSPCNDPLHVQKQIVSFLNSDKSLRSLTERGADRTGATARNALSQNRLTENTALIAQVLPITAQPKQVQVNINTGAEGIAVLTLFKEVVKTIG